MRGEAVAPLPTPVTSARSTQGRGETDVNVPSRRCRGVGRARLWHARSASLVSSFPYFRRATHCDVLAPACRGGRRGGGGGSRGAQVRRERHVDGTRDRVGRRRALPQRQEPRVYPANPLVNEIPTRLSTRRAAPRPRTGPTHSRVVVHTHSHRGQPQKALAALLAVLALVKHLDRHDAAGRHRPTRPTSPHPGSAQWVWPTLHSLDNSYGHFKFLAPVRRQRPPHSLGRVRLVAINRHHRKRVRQLEKVPLVQPFTPNHCPERPYRPSRHRTDKYKARARARVPIRRRRRLSLPQPTPHTHTDAVSVRRRAPQARRMSLPSCRGSRVRHDAARSFLLLKACSFSRFRLVVGKGSRHHPVHR
jgi:hypothetical protein